MSGYSQHHASHQEHPADDVQDHFKDKPLQEHGPLWNELWERQNTSWDRGGPSLALREALNYYPELFDGTYPDLGLLSDFVGHGPDQPTSPATAPATTPRKKALVPACGRGYDAVLLAKVFGYDVVGLEISSSALDAAREYLNGVDTTLDAHQTQQQPPGDNSAMRFWVENQSSSPGRVNWVSGDFFSDDWLADASTEKFDLIFDYTVRLSQFVQTPPTPFLLRALGHELGSSASILLGYMLNFTVLTKSSSSAPFRPLLDHNGLHECSSSSPSPMVD